MPQIITISIYKKQHVVAFACNAKSFAVAIIFFSLFFSTANLDGLMKASCGTLQIFKARWVWLGRKRETLCDKYLLISEILFVKRWHAVCCRESNNGESNWAYIVFYDANSVLYTVTNIYWKARILLKVILEFCSENCAFFMVTSIHNIWKSTKNKNVETRWKVTEDSRRHKAQTGQKTEILLINTTVWRNRKEKMVFNKRNWFIHSVKVILSAILSDNIAVYDGWIIHQPFLKKLSNQ